MRNRVVGALALCSLLVAFAASGESIKDPIAKTGNPNAPGMVEWPAYAQNSERMLDIGDEPRAVAINQVKALEFLAAR